MQNVVRGALVTAALVGVASTALAQQRQTLGLVMGYPASVGLLWHVGDRVAIRPDVTLSRTTTEIVSTATLGFDGTTQTSTTTTESWTTAAGVSGLFYLGAPEPLRFYLAPRMAWSWARSDTDASSSLAQLGAYESDGDGWLVAGSFGAQYAPHDRFRLFGELGLTYSRQEVSTGFSASRSVQTSTGTGLRSGVGVVVYF